MSHHFFEKLINRPVAVSMLYGTLLVGGTFAFMHLPLELAPEKEYPRLSIAASWGNTSPETMEQFITAPIEEIANTVQGVRKVSSTSDEGQTSVDLEFEPGIDMNFARLELNEKLAAFAESMPPGASPPIISRYVPRDLRDLQGFLSYSLSGGQSAQALSKYAEETIVPALLSLKGIANAQVIGGEKRELQVSLDPAKVVALGLNSDEITSRLREIEFNKPVGSVDEQGAKIIIAVRNSTTNLHELESQIVARLPNDVPVRLQDIATVRDGVAEVKSFYRINGKPSITLIINKEQGVNTLKLADAVFDKLAELQKDFPPGLKLIKESDKSEKLRSDLDNLYKEIIISLLCIGFVLTLFLRSLKASALVLSSIFFSLAGTFLIFWGLGIGLNLLTMAGLVLGFGRLVDDSIVVLDNIYRHSNLQEIKIPSPLRGREGWSSADSAITASPLPSPMRRGSMFAGQDEASSSNVSHAVHEIALPVIASTITTVGALLPLEFLPPDLKPYFLDFGIAVAVSLIMSLFVSFTLIPTVTYRIDLTPFRISPLEWIGDKGTKLYQAFLRFSLRRKKFVIALTIWIFGLPVWLMPDKIESQSLLSALYGYTFGSEYYLTAKPYINYILGGSSHLFFAKVSKGEIWNYVERTYLSVYVSFPRGTELERFDKIASDIERQALEYGSSIAKVTTRVAEGSAVIRIDVADSAAMTALPYELKNQLTLFAAQTGGASISVSGFGPGFYSGGEGGSMSFRVGILGYNYNRVREIAEEFKEQLSRNPRVQDVDIEGGWGRKTFELFVTVDRDAIARHGFTVAEVVRAILNFSRGSVTQSTLNIEGERVPYIVKFIGYRNYSVDDLQKSVIANGRGDQVRLGELIKLEERRVPSQITRENQQYIRNIAYEYKGPWQYGTQHLERTIKAMPLPSGYQFNQGYEFFRFREEQEISLILIALLAFTIVFMVTASLYESLLKPFIVILAIPLSLIGLFLAFYLMEVPFGRGGYAAVVLLIGIVVTNSVVLVDYLARHLHGENRSESVLIDAASTRLRPILMTTLTTIGGMLPLLLMGDKSSLWYQLSVGTIGGLTSSMLLTLIVVPVVYAKVYKAR
ncbi:MAG: efflux RND transporter permease subunit [bacterium]